MTAIGIGVRVWVGWCPDNRNKAPFDPRLQQGIIIYGPVGPYAMYPLRGGIVRSNGSKPKWVVRLDSGQEAGVAEHLLTPIDDSEEAREAEKETESCAK